MIDDANNKAEFTMSSDETDNKKWMKSKHDLISKDWSLCDT